MVTKFENLKIGETMLNKAILIGRLGKDPETRYTSGGTAVCNFTLATDESFKDRNGERQKRTEWHRIVCWQKLAEICQQYLKKGALVYIEGKIETNKWTDKQGAERETKQIRADVMRMLGKKEDGDSQAEERTTVNDHGAEIDDSDIPF